MKHTYPRGVFKGATLFKLSPKGAWLLKNSEQRFLARKDAERTKLIVGEIGSIDPISIVTDRLQHFVGQI